MKKQLISFLFCLVVITSIAQQKYYVYFTDKNGVSFNPYEYFDAKAIERRIQSGISLYDITDYPVQENYVNTVALIADSTGFASRWFNFVSAYVSTDIQLEKIKSLPFVKEVDPAMPVFCNPALFGVPDDNPLSGKDISDLLIRQTRRMGGNLFSDNKIDGKGIRIAIFDGGFPNTDVSPVFDDIRKENRIIKTWDFSRNKKENVYYGISHGTMVMACIGGMYKGKKIGLATGAEFLLAKTEVKSEPYREEENWLAAAEWADKNGANIINSSLGYTNKRYFNYQMDGKYTLVTRAANMAAKKGILVVNAAGNEGSGSWYYIGAPADADSVISVGGIDPNTDIAISFSSFGPTVDKRMKPNVAAYGSVASHYKNQLKNVQGTSFASPLVAGFAACAWQTNRQLSNMDLFLEIEKSGHLYPYFDYVHGYGIPQASYFTDKNRPQPQRTFNFLVTDSIITIVVKPEVVNDKEHITGSDLLYYHIKGSDGVLKKFFVVKAGQKEVVILKADYLEPGDQLVAFFRGFTDTFLLNKEK